VKDREPEELLSQIANGRTDLVFDIVAAGIPATQTDERVVPLIRQCAYYGDVSAIRFLLAHGESLSSLGENFDLNGAAFHGHWRLCEFVLEHGAKVNSPLEDTGETPLHAALCKTDTAVYDRVVKVLLAHGADPNCETKPGIETGAFMRDCRTKAETPLHRAAAFGGVDTIQMLLDAGAKVDTRDMNGDSPLTWASWHLRPTAILRLLCFGKHRIHPQYQEMRINLVGKP
jgi:ankyrin repeat protein